MCQKIDSFGVVMSKGNEAEDFTHLRPGTLTFETFKFGEITSAEQFEKERMLLCDGLDLAEITILADYCDEGNSVLLEAERNAVVKTLDSLYDEGHRVFIFFNVLTLDSHMDDRPKLKHLLTDYANRKQVSILIALGVC